MYRPIGYTRVTDDREFTRRAKRYAKRAGLDFRFVSGKGEGSHSKVFVGSRETVVKRAEISKAMLHAMLRQLEIDKEDF